MSTKRSFVAALALMIPLAPGRFLEAQGVTTSTISARVRDSNGNPRSGVRVTAVHQPSGTSYQGRTRDDGRATIPGMRVGGPYTVTASAIGLESQSQPNVYLTLGQTSDLDFVLRAAAVSLLTASDTTSTCIGFRFACTVPTGNATTTAASMTRRKVIHSPTARASAKSSPRSLLVRCRGPYRRYGQSRDKFVTRNALLWHGGDEVRAAACRKSVGGPWDDTDAS